MKTLNYETLNEIGYDGYLLKDAPERVLQFGEGNFLRAFVDYFIDMLNEKTRIQLQSRTLSADRAGSCRQDQRTGGTLHTLSARISGWCESQQKRIISCVSRCLNPYNDFEEVLKCAENPDLRYITCNTTEAGIAYDPSCRFTDVPASSYPGKLTQFLYRRFQTFGSETGKGFVILSCELIDNNGKELEKCVLQICCTVGAWR